MKQPLRLICDSSSFYRAMLCIAQTMLPQDVSLSARMSHAGILSKWLNISVSSNFLTVG